MSVWRLVVGIVWFGLGLFYILARDRLSVRQRQLPILWIVFGSIAMLLGVFWLIFAFV